MHIVFSITELLISPSNAINFVQEVAENAQLSGRLNFVFRLVLFQRQFAIG